VIALLQPYATHRVVLARYLNFAEHALGLGEWAKEHGATLVATNDKDCPNSSEVLEHLADASACVCRQDDPQNARWLYSC
jgi:hypothetical protein